MLYCTSIDDYDLSTCTNSIKSLARYCSSTNIRRVKQIRTSTVINPSSKLPSIQSGTVLYRTKWILLNNSWENNTDNRSIYPDRFYYYLKITCWLICALIIIIYYSFIFIYYVYLFLPVKVANGGNVRKRKSWNTVRGTKNIISSVQSNPIVKLDRFIFFFFFTASCSCSSSSFRSYTCCTCCTRYYCYFRWWRLLP